jgi:CHASE2 domain-containing sensor protein
MFQPGALLNKRYKVLRQIGEGGFGLIFEVRDVRQRNLKNAFGLWSARSVKILKVLNAPPQQKQDAEFLFRREASLLKRLDHPQVVKYVDDFDHIENLRTLPCLVLEKVPGQTLEEWLKQHGPVPEEVALDWLGQCAEILDYLHNQQRVMHLDINPSNIIIKPNGELVLIDFGIARLISQTLLVELIDTGDPENHRAGTEWYMAPEQRKGKPVSQSDIYALGRTIIQALANCPPEQIPEDDEGGWLWEEFASGISSELKSLLEAMTNYSVRHRPVSLRNISKQVRKIYQEYFLTEETVTSRAKVFFSTVLLPSVAITILVMLMRILGFLEPFELFTYDQMVKLRPDFDGPDPNLVIIKITGKTTDTQLSDIEYQRSIDPEMPENVSLSDYTLKILLDKIQPYQPAVVGLDIFGRSFEDIPNHENVIGICTLGNPGEAQFQDSPPVGLERTQIGFVDLDNDRWFDTVRRHQVIREYRDHCPTQWSFAYRLAQRYAIQNHLPVTDIPEQPTINDQSYLRILPYSFLYTRFNPEIYQILINYRTHREVTQSYSFQEVIEETSIEQLSQMFQGKVVLIGSAAFSDFHRTPFGIQSGITLQAHKVSHLLDVALGKRKDLSYFSSLQTAFWVLGWSLFYMSFLNMWNRTKCTVFFIFLVYLLGMYALVNAWVMPIIPVSVSILFLFVIDNKFFRRSMRHFF